MSSTLSDRRFCDGNSTPIRQNLQVARHAQTKNGFAPRTCAACGRPFEWRKKWARDWESVRWCSDACRRART